MDLRTSYPYSLLRKGIISSYPSLYRSLQCEVAVIGAGITGAMVAYELCKAGIPIAVFDKRHAGMGSTAASTSLLQYELDVPLRLLIKKIGERNAVRSYLLCLQAIEEIEKINARLEGEDMFRKKPSFQYASYKKDVEDLYAEYQLRKKAGLDIQWMSGTDIGGTFGFKKPAGIFSKQGAEIDAYNFTHNLLGYCIQHKTPVFDHTKIIAIKHHRNGVELLTGDKNKVKAKKIVIACGYESANYLPKKVERFQSTYAIASEPFASKNLWYKEAMIWETADPYLYIRSTTDNRVIVGGKDEDFINAKKRDAVLKEKAHDLRRSFLRLFPSLPLRIDFKWAGTFASTKDGLPYIGTVKEVPHTYFAMGYGGNGIAFSFIAARIIADLINGNKNNDAAIFGFNR